MMQNIKKPTFVEPPKTFKSNQLYEPVKLYKMVTVEQGEDVLQMRVREKIQVA